MTIKLKRSFLKKIFEQVSDASDSLFVPILGIDDDGNFYNKKILLKDLRYFINGKKRIMNI